MWQYIECPKCKYYESNCKNRIGTTAHTCFGFDEKGREQTNFDFMRSCTMEEMAEMLANESKNVINDFENFDFKREHKEFWEMWLKDKHHAN